MVFHGSQDDVASSIDVLLVVLSQEYPTILKQGVAAPKDLMLKPPAAKSEREAVQVLMKSAKSKEIKDQLKAGKWEIDRSKNPDSSKKDVAKAITSEVITPRPITPTFGCAKETHPHTVGLWLHDVWSRRLLVVCRGEVSWEGEGGRPYYSRVASVRGGLVGRDDYDEMGIEAPPDAAEAAPPPDERPAPSGGVQPVGLADFFAEVGVLLRGML